MRIRPSKNRQAVDEAIAMFELDAHAKTHGYGSEVKEGGVIRGPRGIVNARKLGLSKHPRARKPKKRDRLAARRFMRLPKLMLAGEP